MLGGAARVRAAHAAVRGASGSARARPRGPHGAGVGARAVLAEARVEGLRFVLERRLAAVPAEAEEAHAVVRRRRGARRQVPVVCGEHGTDAAAATHAAPEGATAAAKKQRRPRAAHAGEADGTALGTPPADAREQVADHRHPQHAPPPPAPDGARAGSRRQGQEAEAREGLDGKQAGPNHRVPLWAREGVDGQRDACQELQAREGDPVGVHPRRKVRLGAAAAPSEADVCGRDEDKVCAHHHGDQADKGCQQHQERPGEGDPRRARRAERDCRMHEEGVWVSPKVNFSPTSLSVFLPFLWNIIALSIYSRII